LLSKVESTSYSLDSIWEQSLTISKALSRKPERQEAENDSVAKWWHPKNELVSTLLKGLLMHSFHWSRCIRRGF